MGISYSLIFPPVRTPHPSTAHAPFVLHVATGRTVLVDLWVFGPGTGCLLHAAPEDLTQFCSH